MTVISDKTGIAMNRRPCPPRDRDPHANANAHADAIALAGPVSGQ